MGRSCFAEVAKISFEQGSIRTNPRPIKSPQDILGILEFSRRALREFWELNPQAKEPLSAWFRIMERSNFPNFSAIKQAFGAADYVPPYTIFDVGGDKFRIITAVHYSRERVYIRHVLTHAEYDRWSEQMRRRGRKR